MKKRPAHLSDRPKKELAFELAHQRTGHGPFCGGVFGKTKFPCHACESEHARIMEMDEIKILQELGAEIPESWLDADDPWIAQQAEIYMSAIREGRIGNLLEKPVHMLQLAQIGDEVWYRAQAAALKPTKKPVKK